MGKRDGRVFVAVRDAAEVDVLEEVGGERPSFHVTGRFSTAEEPTGIALAPDDILVNGAGLVGGKQLGLRLLPVDLHRELVDLRVKDGTYHR